MPPGSPPLGGFREFLKRSTRRAKKVFQSQSQTSTPRTASPSPHPSPQLTSAHALHPQPVPSTSHPTPAASSPAPEGIQSSNVESRFSQAAKQAAADVWTGLKVTLQLLEKSSDVFPPLKSAVAGFLGVVDIFETAAQNRRDYAELASNLQSMVHEFTERPGEQTSSRMLEALNAMASGLQEEMKHVQEQQEHSGFRRHLEGGKDSADVQDCYTRVENLRRELQNKALLRIWSMGEEQQVDACLDRLNAALKAMYDSKLSTVVGRRKCTPGTREAILADMQKWADDLEGPKVYWLNGMAGTGKTTLAYSFCAEMQLAGRLGASFFCSRADADSRDVSRIVPTIAYQLARLLPSYREVLIRRIGEDKDIGERTTESQFQKLIRDPLHEIKASIPTGIIVTIDAIDECDRRDGAQNILDALLHARDLPIKFFVTCRPEPGLYDALRSKDEHHRSVLHLHDIEASFVRADIRTYLEAELGEIALPVEKLRQLAEQAGTLFIYAATAVRYIHPKSRKVNFHQRLDEVLSITSKSKSNKHKGIDDLYSAVIAAPFVDDDLDPMEKENIRLVLDTAVCAREPMSVSTMTKLLGLDDEQDIVLALQHLRSVLHVSDDNGLISTLHASFPDFMLSHERSGDRGCKAADHNRHLAICCFSMMQRLLRFNICNLESSFVLDENVPHLAKKIDDAISPELFYACRYWGDHLGLAEALNDVHFALGEFLANRLLFWMEVMNLRNCIGAGARVLTQAHRWLQKSEGANEMVELAFDADRFVSAFAMNPASRSTPHIYVSALPFWPKTRPVRLRYCERTRGLIRLEGPAMERRDLSCLATWTTTSLVLCVAFSPDGTYIVSGSLDKTIRVWDTRSGAVVVGPFEGHTDRVNSVAFSPDGTHIVSASDDKTIRVWDARSGLAIVGPFEGHTSRVCSVAFSPDGTRIVSGSRDKTIRVWDVRSGVAVAGPFEGHADGIESVAFSLDGARIVSGSSDKTIRVWDACSGLVVAGPFEGHAAGVSSVAFSPDGTRVVSGSQDKTIRVWDARSGVLLTQPIEGHVFWVYSVAFSPDGTRIVSGSADQTIRVWDACSGAVVAGPFEGHTAGVYSVVFSPDGTRIVSGSADQTIRVWDAHYGGPVPGPFEGHTNWVHSVAFSPNGTCIVSGSADSTIRVWDARSGGLMTGPFEGHTDVVKSIAFSPDGTRIVSGSRDKTIRVWDARSGLVVAGPFEGHTAAVYSIAFSPDGTHIVSGSYDRTIRVWDARSGVAVAGPFKGHTAGVNSVAFSPDGTHIASGSADSTIRVWDARSGSLMIGPFEGHTDGVRSVAFSPDGTRIVSGSRDKTVRVWDAHSGLVIAGPFEGHTAAIYSVAFSPDGTCIISGSRDKTIRVWDARSGDVVNGPFMGHTNRILSVGFSPDGTRVVSGSNDATIRVWDAFAPDTPDSRPFGDWTMDEDGMITTPQGLLLHVPADLHPGLMWPRNTICICGKGTLALDFDGVLLGRDWVKCYQC